jgi:hypothetical protein
MASFAPRGQLVKSINRFDGDGNIVGAAYQWADAR